MRISTTLSWVRCRGHALWSLVVSVRHLTAVAVLTLPMFSACAIESDEDPLLRSTESAKAARVCASDWVQSHDGGWIFQYRLRSNHSRGTTSLENPKVTVRGLTTGRTPTFYESTADLAVLEEHRGDADYNPSGTWSITRTATYRAEIGGVRSVVRPLTVTSGLSRLEGRLGPSTIVVDMVGTSSPNLMGVSTSFTFDISHLHDGSELAAVRLECSGVDLITFSPVTEAPPA